MPKLEIKIAHSLSQPEALSRIKNFLPEFKAQHADRISDMEESWNGNINTFSFKVSGFHINGTLDVENDYLLINGSLPLLASMFSSTIESTIREKAEMLLRKE
ncbi:MAG: polyhydroxyalkanoic acid system family protein [Ignavibacteria bacterium]|nr:polyhydroxyalkanoic acid system family protein [Ignavibacteria bacterium]